MEKMEKIFKKVFDKIYRKEENGITQTGNRLVRLKK